MGEWEICENEGCGKLFPTYGDMQKHMFYHCGNNDENPITDNNNDGELAEKQCMALVYQVVICLRSKGK